MNAASDTVQALVPAVLALSPYDRLQLAKGLIESVPVADTANDFVDPGEEGLTGEEWQSAWEAEINRRVELINSGSTQTIPASEMFTRIRERLNENRPSRSRR